MTPLTDTFIMPRLATDDPDGCLLCATRVANRLREEFGILQVEVDPAPARLTFTFDSAALTADRINSVAVESATEMSSRFVHEVIPVEGMDCANCAQKIEIGVGRIDGVEQCAVNLMAARVAVEYDRGLTDREIINRRIIDLGYGVASPDNASGEESGTLRQLISRRENQQVTVSAVLTILGITLLATSIAPAVATVSFLAAVIAGGLPLARKGIRSLIFTRTFDINILMTVAVIGAVLIGEWVEAAVVVVLFSLSEALEGYAMDRARNSIRSLMNLAPANALTLRKGEEIVVPASEVEPGETIIVRPGEKVPLDGVLKSGSGSVNQAALTGESLPVAKESGDALLAGTLNGSTPLTITVTRYAGDSSVARIIQLVEHAQAQRAPIQRTIDRFARYYTPAVMALAALIAIVPPLLTGDWSSWIYRSLVLLVIACPCALVLSTPISIVSALSAAARRGILIKGGAVLERAASIATIAFDKTGTLTTGEIQVTTVLPAGEADPDTILSLAASLEKHSEHPLGRAIVREAQRKQLSTTAAVDVETITGAGLTASVDGIRYTIGSLKLFPSADITPTVSAAIETIEGSGGTAVFIGNETEIVGLIGLADTIRSEAAQSTRTLHQLGIENLVMLSGDREPAAAEIAKQTGIDTFEAELMPAEKLEAVERLKSSGRTVAMVGDGVNDAPALAAADIGIAMGAAGTDAALETADIALMSDDLTGLARVVELGRRTRTIIGANIALALSTKAIFLGLAVTGTATLWMAIFADVGTSLIVIANGLRLYRD